MQDVAPALLTVCSQTEKAQSGFRRHRAGDGKRHAREQDIFEVWQNVAHHDDRRGNAHRLFKLDIGQFADLLDARAQDACRARPCGDADRQNQAEHAALEVGNQQHRQRQGRNCHRNVDHSADGFIRRTAEVSGDKCQSCADQRNQQCGKHAEQQRHACAVNHLAENILPQIVRPQQMLRAGLEIRRAQFRGVIRRDEIRENRNQAERQNDAPACDSGRVMLFTHALLPPPECAGRSPRRRYRPAGC